jgi:hypothetical protein
MCNCDYRTEQERMDLDEMTEELRQSIWDRPQSDCRLVERIMEAVAQDALEVEELSRELWK